MSPPFLGSHLVFLLTSFLPHPLEFRLRFASKHIAARAYQYYHQHHLQRLYWFLNISDPRAAGLRGQLFEPLAHQELTARTGKAFELASLASRGSVDDEDLNEEELDWEDADSEATDVDEDVDMEDVGSRARLLYFTGLSFCALNIY